MSIAVEERPVLGTADPGDHGGGPARRAMTRWAWRLFRREWRGQALVLSLLIVAVAATTVGLGVVTNVSQLKADPTFGTATAILSLPGSNPDLATEVAAIQRHFGRSDVVAHQSIPVPGSISTVDLRAENPHGPFVHVTVRLDSGRYPAGPNQVAVTNGTAATLDLHIGSIWREQGRSLQVVGLVENPLDLLDQFALVAPGQANPPSQVSVLIDASQASLRSFRPFPGRGLSVALRAQPNQTSAEVIVLVLTTIGLLFVGLLSVAGFTVIAQRRLRALGTLGAIGATDRHLRLVMLANGTAVGASAAVVGTVVGLLGWLAFVPTLESTTEHRIDRFALPWWAIAAAMLLTFATAVAAAWWPARAVARIPTVAALSGRPPRPQPTHRFAALGCILLATGLVLLAFAEQRRSGFIVGGTVATVVGLLLLAPLAIRAVGRTGRRCPVPARLAVRDLARYQARSGAALGAITLAIGIATTIAVSAATVRTSSATGNLPANELVLYLSASGSGGGNPVPPTTPAQQRTLQARVDQLAAALHAGPVLTLDQAFNPSSGLQAPPPGQRGGRLGYLTASLAQVSTVPRGENVMFMNTLYVATPAVLAHYGITPTEINPSADVVTSQKGLGGLQIFDPVVRPGEGGPAQAQLPRSSAQSATTSNPTIQTIKQLPVYASDPTTLITSHAVRTLGLKTIPAAWLIDTPGPLTSGEIDTAQKAAGAIGLYVETRTIEKSLAPLRNWSTAAGILLALGVLGMTVGLIRSETANELRILAASGASSTTRRSVTGATAGALALLGAVLGTAGAYAALLTWHHGDLRALGQVPITNLVVIVVGLPLVAAAGGWLLGGRQPPAMARRPLD